MAHNRSAFKSFRITRAGDVIAIGGYRRGRPFGPELYIGRVWREGRVWRNDQVSDAFGTQDAAGKSLFRVVIGAR